MAMKLEEDIENAISNGVTMSSNPLVAAVGSTATGSAGVPPLEANDYAKWDEDMEADLFHEDAFDGKCMDVD